VRQRLKFELGANGEWVLKESQTIEAESLGDGILTRWGRGGSIRREGKWEE
jgi:hypothetical protein